MMTFRKDKILVPEQYLDCKLRSIIFDEPIDRDDNCDIFTGDFVSNNKCH